MNTEYIALIPFLILMVVFALLNSAGKKKFGAFLQALDKKEYNLKDVMPAGFALMDAVHYDYTSGLDRIGDFFPGAEYLRLFRELGGEIVTLGSDAHKASVTGDTVGDTRKDVVGVALDIFIKSMSTVANTLASVFSTLTLFR